MHIICNKIRIICSKIRVGVEGGQCRKFEGNLAVHVAGGGGGLGLWGPMSFWDVGEFAQQQTEALQQQIWGGGLFQRGGGGSIPWVYNLYIGLSMLVKVCSNA